MLIKFEPKYTITEKIAKNLMQIEALKEQIKFLPLTPYVLEHLRQTAKLQSVHYSTAIEGNILNLEQVKDVLEAGGKIGHDRDENEIKGYYSAVNQLEKWAKERIKITEEHIQLIHGFVMSNGNHKIKPTPYREGQNVIRNSLTNGIVYMPPEAKDVSGLMAGLVEWINQKENTPVPITAGVAHYQFATIHPYYDGNGRTARLLATLILHLASYDLKGLYSLEEYYAKDLEGYYEAIQSNTSHNYYLGRATADITQWVDYFIEGMKNSFEKVLSRMNEAKQKGDLDVSPVLRELDPKQRKILSLFKEYNIVTGSQIGNFFGFKPRTSALLCKQLVESQFLIIVDASRKSRRYKLSDRYAGLV